MLLTAPRQLKMCEALPVPRSRFGDKTFRVAAGTAPPTFRKPFSREPLVPQSSTATDENNRPPLDKGGLQGGGATASASFALSLSLCKEEECYHFIPMPRTWRGALCAHPSRRLPRHLSIVLLICLSSLNPASASADSDSVTVGVFSLFRADRVEIETQQETMVSIQSGVIETRRVLVEGQRLQVERLGDRLKVSFFERDGRLLHANQAESVRTQEAPCIVSVPGRIRRKFFGGLEVAGRRGHLLPRIFVAEEVAVGQILRSEMAECQEPAALKAQAVLVRSYLRTSGERHRKEGYDFCDTTHCQFFTDFREGGDQFQQAAFDSQGLVLTFLGKPFQPLYTAACGGRTLEGFSGSAQSTEYPGYRYRSVVCGFCTNHPLFVWESTVETKELLHALKGEAREDPTETLASLAEPGKEGELGALKQKARIRVGRVLGWNIIRSNRYTIETSLNSARIKGHGSGHNLGLCQAGAIELGRQGKSMTEILSFYFPGCRIAR